MSSKINIIGIVSGHLSTLKNTTTKKISFVDLFTFYIIPTIAAAIALYFGFTQSNDLSSLLVNFGAIFTALLLSVLVLVYDQGTKISEKIEKNGSSLVLSLKEQLLNELYFNICYSIVISISLVFLCLIEKIIHDWSYDISCQFFTFSFTPDKWIISPIIIFLTVNLMLTILMIVKRMHVLLTAK
ncbi:hypothetical protein ABHN84_08290 [Shewanella vesiculosa]|uniref:Uncharacterized protein n=1 Tax=Shewanella vesiculosa TaxID=518738 RepID=A0ABV0FN90_9GAMM